MDPEPSTPQPLPRAAVNRYWRQGDSEARLRAQQQRHRRQQQREAQDLNSQEDERERDDSALARSASTESGFHTHTDRAEGDDSLLAHEGPPGAEGNYQVQPQPEVEGYRDSAEAQRHQATGAVLPEPCEAPDYSNYMYSQVQPYFQALGPSEAEATAGHGSEPPDQRDETYSEPYDIYSLSEHVYEEICDAPTAAVSPGLPSKDKQALHQRRAAFRLLEDQPRTGDYRQQKAVGSRLHHYDERSDGESDSPEKEAEFAPYPRADSCEQDEDADSVTVELRDSHSSHILHCAKELHISEEHEQPEAIEKPPAESLIPAESNRSHSAGPRVNTVRPRPGSPTEEQLVRSIQEKRDAISLAIKDIKEAIEEVKTRTVRSPYTPDEPKEPVWVMRQDLSPTADCELQGDARGKGATGCCCGPGRDSVS